MKVTRFPAVYPIDGNRSPEAEYGCQYLASFMKDTFVDDQCTYNVSFSFPYFECISEMAQAGYICIWIGSSKALGACQHIDDLVVIQIPEGIMLFASMDVDSANRFITYVQVNQFFYDPNVYLFLPNYPEMMARDLVHLYPLEYRVMSRGIVFCSQMSEKQLYQAVINQSMLYPLIDLDSQRVTDVLQILNKSLKGLYQLTFTGLELLIEEASFLEGEEILTLFLNTYASLKSPGELGETGLLPIGDRLKVKEVDDKFVYYFLSDQGGYFEVAQSDTDILSEVYRKFIRGEYFSPWARKIAKRYLGYLVSVETSVVINNV